MEDYFCIPKNVEVARLFIEYLSRRFKDDKITISFVREDFDLYESYPIVDYGRRFKITVVPSILFKSKENISIIVFNPQNNPNKSSLSLVEIINRERTLRIVNILYGLTDKFSIHISPKQVIEKLNKIELSDLYLASDLDILELIVESGYCTSVGEAKTNFFNKINLPRLSLPYDALVKKLAKENDLYVVNPNNFINSEYQLKNISGFIMNYKDIDDNIKNFLMQNHLDLRFGSGRYIE